MASEKRECWAGLDWSDKSHAVGVVDAGSGAEISRFEVPHSAEGLGVLVAKLRECGTILGVAVETESNMAVVQLLHASIPVFHINPKLSKKWRDCHTIAPGKTDPFDAWVLADGLRHHHETLHPLHLDDDATRRLAMLCQDEHALIEQRTALVNELIATVKTYYPQALAWFDDFTTQASWDFILTFDNPEALRNARKQKLIGFLKSHREKLTPERQQLINNRKADSWPTDLPTSETKSFLAVQICKQLRTLQASLSLYRKRIADEFEKHPKSPVFSSLPGAGPKLSARLLSIFADNQNDSPTIEALCGVVPVTSKSGNHASIFFRRACNKFYRHTWHLFAGQSIIHCQWARAFYDSCRAKGQGHSLALRNLSRKWINIIHAMSLSNQPYDDAKFLTALITHGSPIISKMQPLSIAKG